MWIDSLIGVFSPEAKFRRLQYRRAAQVIEKRGYEGAAKTRRTSGWRTNSTSANAEIGASIETLRNRSRDLVRNNPYAARGISLIETNVIGGGILATIKNESDSATKRHQALWRSWAENSEACDYDGCLTFYGIQALVTRSMAEAGEILVRRRRVQPTDINPLGLQLQVLESDHLVTTRHFREPKTNNAVIQGIEVDSSGRPVAYHLYADHPGNNGISLHQYLTRNDIIRVPAEDIIHVYRKERAGQLRGVPWLAPVIIRMRDLDEYEDAELVRQKIAACFAGFIHDIQPPDDISTSESDEFDIEKFEPGMMETLPPGKNITFADPPVPQGDHYPAFTGAHLRAIAIGLGLSYEALTGDLSNVNFSSARMGWLEMHRNIEFWRANIINPRFNRRTAQWFGESASIIGQGMDSSHWHWTAPRREMIDPTKEIPAKIKAVRAGLETFSDVIKQNGKDPEEHFAALAADNAAIDKNKLVLDTDPRKTNNSGSMNSSELSGTE